MLAQRKREVRQHSAKKASGRTKKGLLLRLFSNKMACILLLASVVCLVLTVYVGAYARVTEEGYRKGELQSKLRDLRIGNEKLEVTLDSRRQPSGVAVFAQENGMVVGSKMVYLKPAVAPHLAQNAQD